MKKTGRKSGNVQKADPEGTEAATSFAHPSIDKLGHPVRKAKLREKAFNDRMKTETSRGNPIAKALGMGDVEKKMEYRGGQIKGKNAFHRAMEDGRREQKGRRSK